MNILYLLSCSRCFWSKIFLSVKFLNQQIQIIHLALKVFNLKLKQPIRIENHICKEVLNQDAVSRGNIVLAGKSSSFVFFQLLLKVRPAYSEADYKVAKQMSAGRQTDKILPRMYRVRTMYILLYKMKVSIVSQCPLADKQTRFSHVCTKLEPYMYCIHTVYNYKVSIMSQCPLVD